MTIGIKVILILYALMLAFIFLTLASIVEEVNSLIVKIKTVKKELDSATMLTDTILSNKADKEDIKREANAMLNVRNDIGKISNRVRKLEGKVNHE